MAPAQSAVTSTSEVTGLPLVSGATISQGTGVKVATVTTAVCAKMEYSMKNGINSDNNKIVIPRKGKVVRETIDD